MGLRQRKLCPDSGLADCTDAWFALTVKPNHEKTASAALRNRGCEEFLPVYRVRNRWSDRIKEIELPLFPGYLFCRPRSIRRSQILAAVGVRDFVGFGKGPAMVSEEEIDAIRKLVTSGMPLNPVPFLKVGQKVRITRGSLRDVEGILLEVKDTLRLVVSVNLLQRSVAVTIDRDFLL